jgi:hypothetical protein
VRVFSSWRKNEGRAAGALWMQLPACPLADIAQHVEFLYLARVGCVFFAFRKMQTGIYKLIVRQ